MQRHISAGDGRSAGSTVGLQDIAIERDRPFTERLQVRNCAQTATDQALDFLRPPALFASCSLPIRPGVGRARQHPIFGREPALPLAFEKAWDAVFNTRGTQNPRFTERNET